MRDDYETIYCHPLRTKDEALSIMSFWNLSGYHLEHRIEPNTADDIRSSPKPLVARAAGRPGGRSQLQRVSGARFRLRGRLRENLPLPVLLRHRRVVAKTPGLAGVARRQVTWPPLPEP